MSRTPLLQLERNNFSEAPYGYLERLEDDRLQKANVDSLDSFAGYLTSSLFSYSYISGSVSSHGYAASNIKRGNDIFCEIATEDRVFLGMLYTSELIGATNGTAPAVQINDYIPYGYLRDLITKNDAAFQIFSASCGVLNGDKYFTIWPKNTKLQVYLTGTLGSQGNLALTVTWQPSSSFIMPTNMVLPPSLSGSYGYAAT